MPFRVEHTDLAQLARKLRRVFADGPPTGYLLGRTIVRDAIVLELECSQLEAERVVDTMVVRGFLRYPCAPDRIDNPVAWTISPVPNAD